eukprot:gene2206-2512_t
MPGANCSIVNCTTHASNAKYPQLIFFKVPSSSAKTQQKKEWRSKLLHLINRADKTFKSERAFICSRRYTEDCFKTGNKGRKTLKTGSLSTLFLPQKSIETPKAKPRRDLSRYASSACSLPAPPELYRYTTFHDLQKDFAKIQDTWKILVKEDNRWKTCKGVADPTTRRFTLHSQATGTVISDVKVIVTNTDGQSLMRVHGSSCAALILKGDICTECTKIEVKLRRKIVLANEGSKKPLAPNAPLKKVSKEKLTHAIKILRLKQKKLENTIKELNVALKQNGIAINENLHNDFTNLINSAQEKLPEESFEKLFWEQQQKAFKCEAKGLRWHPMMIRFALHIHLRFPSAYRALKESGVIKLPCERTLRDYSNIIHPKVGFNKETFDDLKHQASKLEGTEKYVVLMFDEVSIKDDLVFDSHTGDRV